MDKIATKEALKQVAELLIEKLQELENRISALENA